MQPHLPLSDRLSQILEHDSGAGPLTVNHLLEGTEGRGFYLVIILLSLPFIVPISIPGVSTVLGVVVALLSLRLAFGLPPRLPRFLGERPLPPARLEKVLRGSIRFLRVLEKWVKPRRTKWMGRPAAICANALLMALMAFLLALPFPPLPPFTNSLPCYALILIAASMMEEDGILIWIGYGVSLGTMIYLGFIATVLEKGLVNLWHSVLRLWH